MHNAHDAALYGAYCDYSGRAHSPLHDPDPHKGSPALDELVGVNPEAKAAFNYIGDPKLRAQVTNKWPALLKKARRKGLVTRGVKLPGKIRILGDSAKVIKGRKLGVVTAVLYMSPATEAYTKAHVDRLNQRRLPSAGQFKGLCVNASPECMAACLGHGSGHLAMDTSKNARIWKTILYKTDKPLFMKLLASEVKEFEKKVKELKKKDKRVKDAAVRLDGATDLGLAKQLAWDFPKVKWYDYTKDANRVIGYLSDRDRYARLKKAGKKLPTKATKKQGAFPPNWHLTFSYSGRNLADSKKILRAGGNVAVVFDSNANFCDPLPEFWEGFKVIDADETDVRYKDPRGRVAGLRFKKSAGRLEAMRAAEPFVEPISGGRKGLMVEGPLGSEKKAREFMEELRASNKKYVIRGHYKDRSFKRGGWFVEYKLPTIRMHPRPRKNPLDLGPAYAYLVSPGENVFGQWPFLLQHIHGGQGDPVYALSSRIHAYGSTMASREELEEARARFEEVLEAHAVSRVPVFSSEREYLEFLSAYEDISEFIRRLASTGSNPGRSPIEEAYLRNVLGNPRRVRSNPLLAIVGNPGHQCSRCGSWNTYSAGSPYAVGAGAGRTEHVQVLVCEECGQEDHAPAPQQTRVAGAGSRARVKSRGRAKGAKPQVKKNRVAAPGKKKKQPKRKRFDLEEGRERFEGYDAAYDAYTDFHGRAPAHVEVYVLDDGQEEVRVEPIHAALHRTLETNYVVPWDSSKRGTLWLHEHKEGHGLRGLQKGASMPNPDDLPLEVYDPATKTTRKLGGQFQVKDWWYD